jgi:hypothetical protein
MKLTIDIDCTPEEARAFLGLPDVSDMQARLLRDLEDRLKAGLAAMEPDALMKQWLPFSLEGMEKMQRAFWSGLSGGAPGGRKP